MAGLLEEKYTGDKEALISVYQTMLDMVPINIMVADKAFNIVFMNETSRRNLEAIEEALPTKVGSMLGQSIDIFHKDPERVRRILSDENNLPHHAEIQIAEQTLHLHVYPLRGKEGKMLFPMLVWENATESRKHLIRFGEKLKELSEVSRELAAAADTIDNVSSSTAEQTESLAAAAEQAAQNTNATAAATEEISVSIAEISKSVNVATKLSEKAHIHTETTREKVSNLVKATQKIGTVVKLINTIAGQTNLLALNATIEAEHAGEAGRGFAVVAHEVKELARGTAGATDEISQNVKTIQNGSTESSKAMEQVRAAIVELKDVAMAVAGTTEEQSAAISEINMNIQQLASAIDVIANDVTIVAKGAVESKGFAGQLNNASKRVSGLILDLEELVKHSNI